jgi:glycosyltransferase involved in cell wall biosynthesis
MYAPSADAVANLPFPDKADLPAYRCVFALPRRSQFAVLIPVLNEGERILRQLAGMNGAQLGHDVLIADGGSTDGSMEVERLRDGLGVTALLEKIGPGRLSAQLRMGIAWALARGYEGVITLDGNDKDDYRAVPEFAAKLAAGFDHLQGSRYVPGGRGVNTPLDREFAVRFLHAPLISLAAGVRYTDSTNGFRGYSRRLLLHPGVRPFRAVFSAYNLHFYLAIRAGQLGLRIAEIPVTRRYPAAGPPPSKIGGLGGKLRLLGETWRAVRGRYDPPHAEK